MSSAPLKFVDKGVSTDIIDCSSAQNLHGVSESDVRKQNHLHERFRRS